MSNWFVCQKKYEKKSSKASGARKKLVIFGFVCRLQNAERAFVLQLWVKPEEPEGGWDRTSSTANWAKQLELRVKFNNRIKRQKRNTQFNYLTHHNANNSKLCEEEKKVKRREEIESKCEKNQKCIIKTDNKRTAHEQDARRDWGQFD